jgi:Ca2+-binding RTX toxin-like protein
VTVNLQGSTATGLGAGVSGAEHVLGGSGVDRLTGSNAAGNVLVGNGSGDVLAGGGGNDILIGGTGADTLTGDGGEDLLIDGFSVHDGDVRALNALMAEWQRTDLRYEDRVGHLMNGGGANDPNPEELYRFNATTVTKDSDGDVLTGSAGQDWFFALRKPRYYIGPPSSAWDTLPDWVQLHFPPYAYGERLS